MMLKSFLFLAAISGTLCLKIEELVVPSVVVEERDSSVILDCKYNLFNENDKGLVVKWFFGDRIKQIYQWIPGRVPQVMGAFKNKVDLTYNASDSPQQRYRAIRLTNPDPTISGEYTCVVSTHYSEAEMSKNMTVISGGIGPHLRYMPDPDEPENVRFVCDAYEVYPIPELGIFSDGVRFENQSTRAVSSWGRFNVSSSVSVFSDNINEGQTIVCRLKMPLLPDFIKESSLTFTPGVATANQMSGVLLLVSGIIAALSQHRFEI